MSGVCVPAEMDSSTPHALYIFLLIFSLCTYVLYVCTGLFVTL